jgi:toxin secretion/phage lysis holin
MTENAIKDTLEYIVYIICNALEPSFIKFVFAGAYVALSFVFDLGQGGALLALFLLVLIDFATGISAAKFLGEPIRSSKIKHTAIKMTAYFVVIAGAHLAEHGLTKYLAIIDETVLAFFLLTELISLLENMGRLGVQTPQKLLNQLKNQQKKL